MSPESAVIAAPPMKKQVKIEIVGTVPFGEKRKDPLWEELAKIVYEQCLSYKSVIAFSEGRRYAEKLAYYVNLLGGRTLPGSITAACQKNSGWKRKRRCERKTPPFVRHLLHGAWD